MGVKLRTLEAIQLLSTLAANLYIGILIPPYTLSIPTNMPTIEDLFKED